MPRELTPAPAVLVEAADPYKLAAMIKRERARRALVPLAPISMTRPGVWGCWVVQLRPVRPAWVRPTTVVVGGAALVAAGWWLVATVVDVLAAIGLAGLLGAAVLLLLLLRLGGGGGSSCTVTVTHRHR